ncbi:hypothetical protein [Chryseobacterium sp. JUb7]|uniref:hypothetical protein n=1 Tax=Chryseobacterium sp. JUb7 TaxID=2940599 RepID=UPI002167F6C2|nr:hypothetical protein [Chryseobacterium sp. JUb7]MCS3531552.1 putative small secreted protein [Chryseobacterium sp. JUb7]
MKKFFLQICTLSLCATLSLVSCNTTAHAGKKPAENISNTGNNQKAERDELDKLEKEIRTEVSKVKCTEEKIADWKPAAMGSRSCGGPKYYIAYPKQMASSILPKIEKYNTKEKEFNKKYNIITQDCTFIGKPEAIRCIGDKAEVIYAVE